MNEEIIDILKEFEKKRVEQLSENSKRLFYAIMNIADERDRLNNIIKQIEELCDKHELGKYDYSVPVFELKEVIKSEYRKHNK